MNEPSVKKESFFLSGNRLSLIVLIAFVIGIIFGYGASYLHDTTKISRECNEFWQKFVIEEYDDRPSFLNVLNVSFTPMKS